MQPLPITVSESYTGFDCRSAPYPDRFYADPEAGCEASTSKTNSKLIYSFPKKFIQFIDVLNLLLLYNFTMIGDFLQAALVTETISV